MRRTRTLVVVLAAIAALAPATAQAATAAFHNFGPNLLADCPNPEGIALDPAGNLYAASFPAFQPVRAPSANICVVNSKGGLVDKFAVPPGSGGFTNLLGELFSGGQLYVVDFANGAAPNGRFLRIDPATHTIATLATGFAAANAIAEDEEGSFFISDSFAGNITKVAHDGSGQQVWKQDVLLTTQGFPPFGANGVAFDRQQEFLYVANTGDSRVLRIPVREDGSAGPVEIFADGATIDATQHTTEALHGADGIMFDVAGNLFVCANQANEVQVLSRDAQLVARYNGTGADALDFPASLVFKGRQLYVTNLSLFDGGGNSKLSLMTATRPGLPLVPEGGD
jgi:sugar lactone lactonase YvrE